jgi:hypothetical protein
LHLAAAFIADKMVICVENGIPCFKPSHDVLQGFGEGFIHSGNPANSVPSYVDPYDLLSEPTVDPYYPVR